MHLPFCEMSARGRKQAAAARGRVHSLLVSKKNPVILAKQADGRTQALLARGN
jgi:hypothetical protein